MPIVRIKYDVDTKELLDADKALGKTDKSTEKLRKETDKLNKEIEESGKTGTKAFGLLKGAIAAIGFASLLTKVIQTTGEFQKMGAVLVNTLGSRSKAQEALNQIAIFASQTPFAVKELTDAFVKLANQGFVPTQKEMKKLGDLAASTGKSFDQLAEGIIDAQVGEFERLKEFGIKASKEGDNVTFTFKGVQTQVKSTQKDIQSYILSLGDVAGVSGAMESISRTLAGQISNLGDSFDAFFFAVGDGNHYISGSINLVSMLVQEITKLIKIPYSETLREQNGELNALVGILKDNIDNEELRSDIITQINQKYPEFLTNLNTENLTTKDLTTNLEKFNREFERKLILQLQEEDNTPLIEETIRLRGLEIEQLKIIKDIEEGRIPAKTKTSELAGGEIDNLSNAQSLLALYKRRQEEIGAQIDENNKKYSELLKSYSDIADGGKKAADGIDKSTKAVSKSSQEVPDKLLNIQQLSDKAAQDAERVGKRLHEIWGDFETDNAEAALKRMLPPLKEVTEATKRYEKATNNVNSAIIDGSITAAQTLLSSMVEAREVDFESFEEDVQRRLELAGDNEEAKRIIEQRAAQERKRLQEEQERREKQATIKRIAIDTAANVIRSILQNGGVPLGLPFGAIAAGLGLAQIAAVQGFEEGGYTGNVGTKDVAGVVHGKEYVIPATQTARSREMLEAIHKGQLDDKTYKVLMGSGSKSTSSIFDDSRIVSAIKENQPPDVISIAGQIYEVKKKGSNLKQRIRRKMLN